MQANSLNERMHLLVEEYSISGRLDNITQVMSLHTQYLESFLRSQFYMLRMDGPLPLPYRHYIAIMVCPGAFCYFFPTLFVFFPPVPLLTSAWMQIKPNFICFSSEAERKCCHRTLVLWESVWNPSSRAWYKQRVPNNRLGSRLSEDLSVWAWCDWLYSNRWWWLT